MLLSLFHLRVYRKDAESIGVGFDKTNVQEMFDAYVAQNEALSDEWLAKMAPDIMQRERIRGTTRRLVQVDVSRDSNNTFS